MPVNHHLVQELFGVELTTTILLPIIPTLFYNYGHRNVSLLIKPLTGTVIDWSNSQKKTAVRANALVSWYIHKDSTDTLMDLAFESILDLDILLSLEITSTKLVNITIESIVLNGFNVTLDNLRGSVKNDEAGIKFRLTSSMGILQAAFNAIIRRHPVQLPEFQLIDYTVKFDY